MKRRPKKLDHCNIRLGMGLAKLMLSSVLWPIVLPDVCGSNVRVEYSWNNCFFKGSREVYGSCKLTVDLVIT